MIDFAHKVFAMLKYSPGTAVFIPTYGVAFLEKKDVKNELCPAMIM